MAMAVSSNRGKEKVATLMSGGYFATLKHSDSTLRSFCTLQRVFSGMIFVVR